MDDVGNQSDDKGNKEKQKTKRIKQKKERGGWSVRGWRCPESCRGETDLSRKKVHCSIEPVIVTVEGTSWYSSTRKGTSQYMYEGTILHSCSRRN